MMQHTPLAALEWCSDPCAPSLLTSPSFIFHSARVGGCCPARGCL